MGKFWSFVYEMSLAVDHSLDFIKKNLRRTSKNSIVVIKPRENKRGNESSVASTERYYPIELIHLISRQVS